MIREKKLPLIKRKSILFSSDGCLPFFSAWERGKLLSYLTVNGLYDVQFIREDLEHRYGKGFVEKIWRESVSMDDLKEFVKKYRYIMVYGAGVLADVVSDILNTEQIPFDGYIVSDGHRKEKEKNRLIICELSELLERREETGIIFGMENRTCEMVSENLDRLGFTHVFCRARKF